MYSAQQIYFSEMWNVAVGSSFWWQYGTDLNDTWHKNAYTVCRVSGML